MRFNDTCLVTGASSGIGLEYARRFARDGAHLVITGRRETLLKERATELREAGAESVEMIAGSLEDITTLDLVLRTVENAGRPVAAIVNSAGYGVNGKFGDTAEQAYEMLRVHVEVPMRIIQQVIGSMRERGSALIVNVGSLAGRVAVPDSATYAATKVFLERFTETLALEEASNGIVVQAMTPGYVKTDFHRAVEDVESKRVNRGLIRWMTVEDVVDVSMRAVRRAERRISAGKRPVARDVVVIPGFANRILVSLAPLFPRTVAYRAAEGRKRL